MIVGQDARDVPVSRCEGLKDVRACVRLKKQQQIDQISVSNHKCHSEKVTCQYAPTRWTWRCGKTFLFHPEGSLGWRRTCVHLWKRVALHSAKKERRKWKKKKQLICLLKSTHSTHKYLVMELFLNQLLCSNRFSSHTCRCNQLSLSSSCFWKEEKSFF